MSTSRAPAVRIGDGQGRITVRIAALTWLASWLFGNLVGASLVGVLGYGNGDQQAPVWVTMVAALALWIPTLVALRFTSMQFGVGTWRDDYRFSFRVVDLIGVPVGVLTQLVLVRLVYWPLVELWPDTFSSPQLEESARDLYDSADGVWLVALIFIVVVGAPVVEELLYRGLLQGAFERRVHEAVAVVVVAVWFALIHFRPVEYPGLLVIGLVLGTCALLTRRLGMGIVAHAAFNATGLVWVATR
jgi:uncharacterized protein